MSDSQPGPESSKPPPQPLDASQAQFAAYPRAGDVVVEAPGTPEQLIALSQGFPWLVFSFFLSIVVMFGVWGLPGDMRNLSIQPLYGGIVVTVFLYLGCRKVFFGLGEHQGTAVLCALVLGATSPFCIGIFLIAVLINSTVNRVFKYGVRRNAWGAFRRSEVLETARRMRLDVPDTL